MASREGQHQPSDVTVHNLAALGVGGALTQWHFRVGLLVMWCAYILW